MARPPLDAALEPERTRREKRGMRGGQRTREMMKKRDTGDEERGKERKYEGAKIKLLEMSRDQRRA